MRVIPIRDHREFGTKTLLKQVVGFSPTKPISIDEMRTRVHILDALVAADAEMTLEDADHAVLCEAIRNYPFSMARAELLLVLDDVLNAQRVPATVSKFKPT